MIELEDVARFGTHGWNKNIVSGPGCFADNQACSHPGREILVTFLLSKVFNPSAEGIMKICPLGWASNVFSSVPTVIVVIEKNAAEGFVKVAKSSNVRKIIFPTGRVDSVREAYDLCIPFVVNPFAQELTAVYEGNPPGN